MSSCITQRATKTTLTIFFHSLPWVFMTAVKITISTQVLYHLSTWVSGACNFQRFYSFVRMLPRTLARTCSVYIRLQIDNLTPRKIYAISRGFFSWTIPSHYRVRWRLAILSIVIYIFGWLVQFFFLPKTVAVLFVSFCKTLFRCIVSRSWIFAKLFLSNYIQLFPDFFLFPPLRR